MEKEVLEKHQKEKFKFHLSFELSIGILVFLLIVSLYLYIYYYFLGGKSKSYISKGKPISFLFLGLDGDENFPKTDAILIGIYNPFSKRIGIIAIPRDLKVKVETPLGFNYEKINIIYSKYSKKKLISEIEKLLGIKIQYYGIISLDNLIKIVDLIGGVELYIDTPMHYIDRAAGLYIDFPKGLIKCDGLRAMKFIRYRADERGDLKRIERFIEFGVAFVRKSIEEKNILTNIKILKIILKYLDTNINFSDIKNILKTIEIQSFRDPEILRIGGKFVELNNSKYIEPDPEIVKKSVKEFFKNLEKIKGDYLPSEIKIQVLNGSGKAGVAKAVRDKLIRNGFNVIEFGNADSDDYQFTIILDRKGKLKKSLKVSSFLNCKNLYVKIDPFNIADVTVIVGKDYSSILK
jgi:LCP family protein required for cell wall assembly